MQYHITVNALPGSYTGVVAYCWRSGKLSVADGPSQHQNVHSAIDALRRHHQPAPGGTAHDQ